ncbi:GPR1/FUN34/yaaH family-domain-containing protein [Xylogone sp. PMI_703]|nr:GPR1/FUN34/yaaH family-domain-containing protein [Xylogone sp. PMI_703]
MTKEHEASYGGHTDMIEHTMTNASITIPIEVFEKRYLTPQIPKADWYKRLGNPTPYGLVGFLMGASPLACTLMGWGGSGGGGVATIGFTYFFGGLLQILASIMEFVLGNTFPFVVFGSFGAFWLGFGATQTPSFDAQGYFTGGDTGLDMSQFYSSYAFGLIFTALLVAIFTLCALRINVVFFGIFSTLTCALICLSVSYWRMGHGDIAEGNTTLKAGGALTFAVCIMAWYYLLSLLLESVDFPFKLPVGDLSRRFDKIAARTNNVTETV